MKYVIHYHETEPPHYDLMLEVEETLLTWQLVPESLNDLLAGRKATARQIQDHRKKYLTYEGPVSCDRGRVDLFDNGEYRVMKKTRNNTEYFFSGEKITGRLVFTPRRETFILQYFGADCL